MRVLRELDDVPWWRVITSDGTVAKEMLAEQVEARLRTTPVSKP